MPEGPFLYNEHSPKRSEWRERNAGGDSPHRLGKHFVSNSQKPESSDITDTPGEFGEHFLRNAYQGRHNYTNVRAQVPVEHAPKYKPEELQLHSSARERAPFHGYTLKTRGRNAHDIWDPLQMIS